MTEEVQTLAEVDSAPAPVVTATTETVETTPEVVENQGEQPEEKKYSQAEIDAMIGKRLAREQRKWEREQQQRTAETQTLQAPVNNGDESAVLQKAEQIIAQREAAKQQAALLENYHDREETAREKYDDFEQVAYNPRVPITEVMAESIRASDIGPDVAYYLGANVKEADRIARLSPILQAKEIGKIEAKLASSPIEKKTSSAPAPISPVTARSSGAPAYDTTDPRSTKTMTDSQWIEAERVRQRKKWEAQNR
jgi:hypothetical protein